MNVIKIAICDDEEKAVALHDMKGSLNPVCSRKVSAMK